MHRPLDPGGVGERFLRAERDDRVERAVDPADPLEVRRDDLDR